MDLKAKKANATIAKGTPISSAKGVSTGKIETKSGFKKGVSEANSTPLITRQNGGKGNGKYGDIIAE